MADPFIISFQVYSVVVVVVPETVGVYALVVEDVDEALITTKLRSKSTYLEEVGGSS